MKKLLRWPPIGSRKSALMTMIITNLSILLIPLSMGLFLYAKVEKSMENSVNRSNTAMLEQLKLSLDNKLAEVDNLMRQVVFHPKLDYLLKIPANADSVDKYRFVEFMRDNMSRYRSLVSSFIFDYYVYFAGSDTIVKDGFLTDSRTFYDNTYRFQNMSYDQWKKQLLTAQHSAAYMPAAALEATPSSSVSIDYVPKDVVVYAQSLPIPTQTDILGNFVVLIDVSHIKQMFAQLETASRSSIYIIDNTGRTIMSTSDTPLAADLLALVEQNTEPFDYEIDGVTQMVSSTSSQKAGWKYVSVTPNDVFMHQVNQIQQWSVVLLLLCLTVGLLAVFAGAYRNYKPLQKTVNAIMRGKDMTGKPDSNEYDFIRQTIEGSIHEEKHLRSMLAQQTPVIRANYLSRLVRGYMDVDVSASSEETLRFMDLSFISDRFAVVLVKIEDISRFTGNESEQQWALVRFIVANIGIELAQTHQHQGFAVELYHDRLALLVNLNPASGDGAEADVREFADTLNNVISNRFRIDIAVAAGGIHQGPRAIRDSYPEALAAMEYRIVMGQNAVIHFRDIADVKPQYYYPLEVEIQLINFVRSGDTDNVLKLLDTIYAMNFGSTYITPDLGKCLFFNVTSTFLKIINSTNTDQDAVLGANFDPLKAVFSHPTAERMHKKTRELYETLTASFKSERSDHSTQLFQEILGLVDQSLDDPNLGLAFIADRFSMTPQYISTFFKKHQGQNLLDYVTRKRIDKAKKLMENKELTNAHIAQMVGYTNDVVFLRAFKKIEGITPGKYRDTVMQMNAEKAGS